MPFGQHLTPMARRGALATHAQHVPSAEGPRNCRFNLRAFLPLSSPPRR